MDPWQETVLSTTPTRRYTWVYYAVDLLYSPPSCEILFISGMYFWLTPVPNINKVARMDAYRYHRYLY